MWRKRFQQSKFEYLLKISLLGAIAFITIAASVKPTIAAEKITFNYGIANQSVSLKELETFAETGKVSPALNFLFEFTNQNPELIRLLLIQEISLDTVTASNLLNSPIGGYILDRVSTIVNSGVARGNREALRSALIKSTNEDGKLSLLEVWLNYPTKEVVVEGTSWRKMTREFARTWQQVETKTELTMTLLHNFLNSR